MTDSWTKPIVKAWQPGEAGARQRLADFGDVAVAEYATARDRPDIDGTSRLCQRAAQAQQRHLLPAAQGVDACVQAGKT